MKVAILYSGGKDSTYAIDYALSKKWDIEYLLSVKPTRSDCYLFHYATVEHTKELAGILGIKHIYASCDVANAKLEAEIVKNIVKENPVDAVVLGGTGLQMTQLKSIQEALMPSGVEVFASHAGQDHDQVLKEMIAKGYRFMISQIASDGLNKDWLGKVITSEVLEILEKNSKKFGFHVGGEGGYFDTLVLDGPIFDKKLVVEEIQKNMESTNVGHVVIHRLKVADKVKAENKE